MKMYWFLALFIIRLRVAQAVIIIKLNTFIFIVNETIMFSLSYFFFKNN